MSDPQAATPQAGETGQPQAGNPPSTTDPTSPQAGQSSGQAPEPQTVETLPAWAQAQIRDARKDAAGYRKRIEEIETAQRQAEEEAAAKRGEWEKVAAERQAEIERLKTEAAERDWAALRDRVAREHVLVWKDAAGKTTDLTEFLTARTEEGLVEQAKKLARFRPIEKTPDTEAGKGGRGGANGGSAEADAAAKRAVAIQYRDF